MVILSPNEGRTICRGQEMAILSPNKEDTGLEEGWFRQLLLLQAKEVIGEEETGGDSCSEVRDQDVEERIW